MTQLCQDAGDYRGEIVEYDIRETKNGATAIPLQVRIDEYWDAESSSWVDAREYDLYTEGELYVRKTNGKINEIASAQLYRAGWSGIFMDFYNKTWNPTPVQVKVEEKEYRGQTSFKIAWINDYDGAPGGGGGMTKDEVQALDNQLGPQMRALAGNMKRNAAPPVTPPVTPPAAPPAAQPAPPTTPSEAQKAKANKMLNQTTDEIPF